MASSIAPSIRCISIHALREEGDFNLALDLLEDVQFLSTPSARRATDCFKELDVEQYISIHALREEGDHQDQPEQDKPPQISIHALREEGDLISPLNLWRNLYFYPRPPRGGRLYHPLHPGVPQQFLSTPSARRATFHLFIDGIYPIDFYPRPPRGGRPQTAFSRFNTSYFYPRPPRGGRPCRVTAFARP